MLIANRKRIVMATYRTITPIRHTFWYSHCLNVVTNVDHYLQVLLPVQACADFTGGKGVTSVVTSTDFCCALQATMKNIESINTANFMIPPFLFVLSLHPLQECEKMVL